MCINMFYAQVLGIWLFLIALAMLVHQERIKKILSEGLSHPPIVFLTGLIGLAAGLLIVISHNVWVSAWPVLITITGWVLLIQGVLRIFWPDVFTKWMKDMMAKKGFTLWSWVWLLVGLYLIWMGFSQ